MFVIASKTKIVTFEILKLKEQAITYTTFEKTSNTHGQIKREQSAVKLLLMLFLKGG